jgi:tetratricopeptide (TPR) repeat protein
MDPLSPVFIAFEARYLFHTGAFDEAAGLLLELIKAHPENGSYYFDLADVLSAQRKFDEAITIRRQAHDLAGDDVLHDVLAKARGEAGYRQIEEAAVRLVELRNLERRVARGGYASPLDFARAYAQVGDAERAFSYFKPAFDDRAPGLVFLKVDRAWDSIRGDARFRDAVTTVGLP